MILAGDIGGTSTRLAYFEVSDGRLRPVVIERYPSRDHGGLVEIVELFRAAHPAAVEQAAFGIAGPVSGGQVVTPNLPWVVEAAGLASALGLATVGLLNDLEANTYGILELGPDDFAVISAGAPGAAGN